MPHTLLAIVHMKKLPLSMRQRLPPLGLLCYLGLSGYVWYYDKQRSKSDVQASVVSKKYSHGLFQGERRDGLLSYAFR